MSPAVLPAGIAGDPQQFAKGPAILSGEASQGRRLPGHASDQRCDVADMLAPC